MCNTSYSRQYLLSTTLGEAEAALGPASSAVFSSLYAVEANRA